VCFPEVVKSHQMDSNVFKIHLRRCNGGGSGVSSSSSSRSSRSSSSNSRKHEAIFSHTRLI
jgi:hypothetical protein